MEEYNYLVQIDYINSHGEWDLEETCWPTLAAARSHANYNGFRDKKNARVKIYKLVENVYE